MPTLIWRKNMFKVTPFHGTSNATTAAMNAFKSWKSSALIQFELHQMQALRHPFPSSRFDWMVPPRFLGSPTRAVKTETWRCRADEENPSGSPWSGQRSPRKSPRPRTGLVINDDDDAAESCRRVTDGRIGGSEKVLWFYLGSERIWRGPGSRGFVSNELGNGTGRLAM